MSSAPAPVVSQVGRNVWDRRKPTDTMTETIMHVPMGENP